MLGYRVSRMPWHARAAGVLPLVLSGQTRDLGLRPRGPDLAGALLALLLGRPDLLPGLGLLERNRLCAVHQHVDRLAHRDVLPQRLVAALGFSALERLLDLVLLRTARRARRGCTTH